jgi:hypothetical protein
MSVFPRFCVFLFGFSSFRVFRSDGSSKTQQKTFCETNVSKTNYKKNYTKTQNRFFFGFVLSRSWGFLGERISKFKNATQKNPTLVLFLAPDEPGRQPGTLFDRNAAKMSRD